MTTAQPTPAELPALIEPFAAGLRADGYEVEASIEHDRLNVRIAATPDACAECLVPKDAMGGLVRSVLRRQGVAVDDLEVELRYPEDR